MTGTNTGARWFAGQLKPNGLAQAERNLSRQGIETFCPWTMEASNRRGRMTDQRRALFPGYIFLRLDPDAGLWRTVNSTRGLTRLVQTDPHAPTPLPDALIDGLRARCDAQGRLDDAPSLASGDRVRVIAGPFADLVTEIDTIGEDARIRVLFDLMNRKVVARLDPRQVRKLG